VIRGDVVSFVFWLAVDNVVQAATSAMRAAGLVAMVVSSSIIPFSTTNLW